MHGKAPVGAGLGHLERCPPITLHCDVMESTHLVGKVQPLIMRLVFVIVNADSADQTSNPAWRSKPCRLSVASASCNNQVDGPLGKPLSVVRFEAEES